MTETCGLTRIFVSLLDFLETDMQLIVLEVFSHILESSIYYRAFSMMVEFECLYICS